jgi:hypothetical protein
MNRLEVLERNKDFAEQKEFLENYIKKVSTDNVKDELERAKKEYYEGGGKVTKMKPKRTDSTFSVIGKSSHKRPTTPTKQRP